MIFYGFVLYFLNFVENLRFFNNNVLYKITRTVLIESNTTFIIEKIPSSKIDAKEADMKVQDTVNRKHI